MTSQSVETYYPKPNHPEWFKAIHYIDETTPNWAKLMYTSDDQFAEIHRLKSEYDKSNAFQKNIHTQNFKYWNKIVEPFVDDQGVVQMPSPGTSFIKNEKEKTRKKIAGGNRSMMTSWANVGPDITYNDGNTGTRPTQANVYCLGVSPSNTSTVYAGMETGGIFKSIDKGLNWSPVTADYAIGNIHDIKIDPLNENIVYATRGQEIYKTTNGGNSWSLIYTTIDFIEQLLIHTSVTDTIYAATRGGLLKSDDGGISWTNIYNGYVYDVEFKPGTTNTLYISIKNDVTKRPEIIKSINNGTSWFLMDNGFYSPSDLNVATVYGCKIGVTPADPNRVFAGVIATGKEGDNGWIGIYYSLNEGASWQEDSGFDGGPYASGDDMNTNWYVAGYSSGYHQGWYNFDIDVSHNNADKLWIGTIWFSESGNRGANIEYIRGTRNLSMHADVQDIDVVGNDIWIASDGGINYSNDECQTMETRMTGINYSDFWGFAQGWNEDIWVGGRYHNGNAVYHENYGPGNTVMLGGAEAATGYVNPFDNRKTHFTDIGDRNVSDMLGEGSTSIPNLGMYPTQSYFHFNYSEVEWHPNYANIVFVGNGNSLFKSTDGGANFDTTFTFPGEIRRFEICRDNPQYLYAIVFHSYWDWRVYKSTNGGDSFSEINTPPYSSGSWRNLSFTVNPFDKNEIWLSANSSDDGNKIFSSIDGGTIWTNRYTAELSGQSIKDLIYQSSSTGDVIYAMTNNDFFIFEKSTSTWTQFSDGLPALHTGFKMLPFYRDEKIRMASAKGIWEVPFDRTSKIQAMPMVLSDSVFCIRDTVFFESRSIVKNDGASWQWSFSPDPFHVSDLNTRNPKVVFGEEGAYDVSLMVTDANGQSDTKSIIQMVTAKNTCEVDTFPGKALRTDANGEFAVVNGADLTNVTNFSITGWWKPDGPQQGFSAIASSGDWCAHCDYTEGLIVSYFGDKLWYKWPGNSANWGSNSGMTIPIDEWSFVALTIEPTKATLYLNEQKYVHNIPLQPGNISNLYLGYGHYSKSFHGDIDEVTIWKKTLTEDEIRLMRHLTKEDIIGTDPDLIAYYQFNTLVNGSQIMDHAGTLHSIKNSDAELIKSTAPIGSGISQKFTVASADTIETTAGVDFYFSDAGSYPNGEIVVTRLNQFPNSLPSLKPFSHSYWVINNYGTNNTFSALSKLSFNDIGNMTSFAQANDHTLFRRSQNEYLSNWTNVGVSNMVEVSSKKATFQNSVNMAGQYILDNNRANGWIGIVSTDWNDSKNWGENVVPDFTSEVIIPPFTPFPPHVEVNVTIKSLLIQPGASLRMLSNNTMTVKE